MSYISRYLHSNAGGVNSVKRHLVLDCGNSNDKRQLQRRQPISLLSIWVLRYRNANHRGYSRQHKGTLWQLQELQLEREKVDYFGERSGENEGIEVCPGVRFPSRCSCFSLANNPLVPRLNAVSCVARLLPMVVGTHLRCTFTVEGCCCCYKRGEQWNMNSNGSGDRDTLLSGSGSSNAENNNGKQLEAISYEWEGATALSVV